MKEKIKDILIMLFDFIAGGIVFFLILNSNLRWVTGNYLKVSDFISYNFYIFFSILISCVICYYSMTSSHTVLGGVSNEPIGYAGSNIVPDSSTRAFNEGLTVSPTGVEIWTCPALSMFKLAFKSR